ncbi:MAG: septum formation initiator family protein [Clostridia bacterium]|nr:septum formation initiator family protein [Clostridia bacterium]
MRKMSENGRKKSKKKLKLIHVILFVFVVYFSYTLYDQQVQMNKYDSQIEMYNTDIKTKKELKEYYAGQKVSMSSDEYIEKIARESLGYVKPYEKVFIDANR